MEEEIKKSEEKFQRFLSLTDEAEGELYDELENIAEKAIQSKEILYDTEALSKFAKQLYGDNRITDPFYAGRRKARGVHHQ